MGAAGRAQAIAVFSTQNSLQRGSQQQNQGERFHVTTLGCEASPERWCMVCMAAERRGMACTVCTGLL